MMLSSMVRFPLVFISGIFVPVEGLPDWARAVSSISPLTYFTDLARYSTTGESFYSIHIDLAVLALYATLFLLVSVRLHERYLPERLS